MSVDRRKPARAVPWVRTGARALALVLSLVVLAGSAYAWANYRALAASVGRVDAISPEGDDGSTGPAPPRREQNILVIGNDDRTGATPAELEQLSTGLDGGSSNTDTMMVLHIPADGSRATVISLPRDSWVLIHGHGEGKLNSAYADGAADGAGPAAGARLLIATVQDLVGLKIDHYVSVSLLAFYRISEAIGGVPVCLTSAQNASTDSDAAGSGYSGIDLPAGESVIEGKQALAFVRQRHGLPRGDLDRIVRQQYFLRHAFQEVASAGTLLNPRQLDRLVTAVSSSLQVDQGLDLLQLADQVQNLSTGNITFVTVPTLGFPDVTYQDTTYSTVQLDYAAIPGFVSDVVGAPTPYVTATPVPRRSVAVTVLNAGVGTGSARRTAEALAGLGFATQGPTYVDSGAQVSQVRYPPGRAAQAKTVVSAARGAVPVVDRDVTGVTLVLAGDGVTVGAPAPQPSEPAGPPPPVAPSGDAPPPADVPTAATDCIH